MSSCVHGDNDNEKKQQYIHLHLRTHVKKALVLSFIAFYLQNIKIFF